MSNASCCRRAAAYFGRQTELADSAEERAAFGELERIWSDMAVLAERFDREHDGAAKAEIYAKMSEVEAVARLVA